MNREQMMEKVVAALTHASWPDKGRDGFPSLVVAKMLAPVVLDAVLPQVTTEAELEALPVRALLLCEFGDTFVVDRDSRAPDFRFLAPNGERWTADGLIEVYGHLTVVWTPEAVS